MKRVKVIKVPTGEAPLEKRKSWKGLILPVVDSLSPLSVEVGIISEKRTRRKDVVSAPIEEALLILEQKDPKAAQWYRENISWANYLIFGADEVEIIGEYPLVICSICGSKMEIKEWMPAKLKFSSAPEDLSIPHMNRSHPCNNCGHLWLSTDNIIPVGNILVWEKLP